MVIEWVRADLRDYQPQERSFQLVLIAYLQLRETELDGVLCGAAAALAPGGVLLMVGHDVTNLTEGTGGPPDPAVLYTPESPGGLAIKRRAQIRAGRRWRVPGTGGPRGPGARAGGPGRCCG